MNTQPITRSGAVPPQGMDKRRSIRAALRTDLWICRMRTAELIFQNYDFGVHPIAGFKGWEYSNASNEASRIVFLDKGDDANGKGISESVSLRIEFAEDQSSAVDVSAIVQRTCAPLN